MWFVGLLFISFAQCYGKKMRFMYLITLHTVQLLVFCMLEKLFTDLSYWYYTYEEI